MTTLIHPETHEYPARCERILAQAEERRLDEYDAKMARLFRLLCIAGTFFILLAIERRFL